MLSYDYIYLSSLALLFLLVLILCWYGQKCNNYWKMKGVPSLSPKLFIGDIGSVVVLKEGMMGFIHSAYNTMRLKEERFLGAYFLTRPVLILCDLDLVKQFLTQDFHHFVDRPFYCNEDRDPLSAHLAALQGKRWKKMRSVLTPVFTPEKMKMIFNTISTACDEFTAGIDNKIINDQAIDINEEVTDALINIIASSGFGIDCNSSQESISEFKRYGKNYLHNPSFVQSFLFILQGVIPEFFDMFNIHVHNTKMTHFFINLVKDIVKFREDNNVIRKDLMHVLLQIKNNVNTDEDNLRNLKSEKKDSDGITLNEIAAQCFIFFLGGFDTSSAALSYCVYEMSLNSAVQDRARKEVVSVLENGNGKITYDSIQKMKYLDMCLFETLRKYPSILGNLRICTQKYNIPDSSVVLDKGTIVYIPVSAIHHDPEYYPNPQLFDPERFSDDEKASRHPCAFLAFGQGPRTCIAYRYALMQMKTMLAALLNRYSFYLHRSTKIPTNYNSNAIFIKPTSKILVIFKKI